MLTFLWVYRLCDPADFFWVNAIAFFQRVFNIPILRTKKLGDFIRKPVFSEFWIILIKWLPNIHNCKPISCRHSPSPCWRILASWTDLFLWQIQLQRSQRIKIPLHRNATWQIPAFWLHTLFRNRILPKMHCTRISFFTGSIAETEWLWSRPLHKCYEETVIISVSIQKMITCIVKTISPFPFWFPTETRYLL